MNSDDHVRLEILRMYCDCTKSFPQGERDQRLLEDAAHFVVHGLFPGEEAPTKETAHG